MKYEREKKIADAIRLTWDSLQSHLEDTYNPISKKAPAKYQKEIGGQKFHKKCVKEYSEIINTLANEL